MGACYVMKVVRLMKIGIPKEIKDHEYRVGLVPSMVHELTQRGHEVFVETNAGSGIDFQDDDYERAGATVLPTAEAVFDIAEMIVKVKEPQPEECRRLRADQILFTYLHLAPDPEQTELLQASGCAAIAYETVTDNNGSLPLLTPMSMIAGRLSVQAGAHCLEKVQGGRGTLLGGVPGVLPGKVLILGGGVVGTHAAIIAAGLEADVTLLERSHDRMAALNAQFGSRLKTLYSTTDTLEEQLVHADLVISGILVPGAAAPKLIRREHLTAMKNGSVFVDVSIDQGGCAETSRATTYSNPTFVQEGVVHYCVANMPGGVPRTATFALNNATFPHVLRLAEMGLSACVNDPHLRRGLNVCRGHITYEAVAKALKKPYVEPTT